MIVRAGARIAEMLTHTQGKTFQDVVLEGFAILAAEIDQLREDFEARPEQNQAQGSGQ